MAELARELADKPWCNGDAYTLADIATGCALGYLDLRHPDIAWRDAYPNLARLAEKLGKRPSFQDTAVAPDERPGRDRASPAPAGAATIRSWRPAGRADSGECEQDRQAGRREVVFI